MVKVKKNREELYKKFNSGIKLINNELEEIKKIPFDDSMRLEKATVVATKLRVFLLDSGVFRVHHSAIEERAKTENCNC